MATFSKLDGVTVGEFFLDVTTADALKLVTSAGPVLEVQDTSGNLIQIKGSNVSAGILQYMSFSIVFGDIGTPKNSTTTLPQNAVVADLRVIVTTPFSGGSSPTLTVGTQDTATLFGNTGDFNLEQANTYVVPQFTPQPNAAARAVRATLAGTATAGAGKVIVGYIISPNS
jgi:hypothetical protein